jgi:hypothetical protein
MTFRAVWLVLALAGIAGCDDRLFPFRGPCPEGETCCPPGSHLIHGDLPEDFVCVADETTDGGADGGACDAASADAP